MTEHFQLIYPVSDRLKEHIYCYYTINSTSDDFVSRHYSFPHTYNAVTIYNGATFNCTDAHLKVEGDGHSPGFCLLQGKRQAPLMVELGGIFSRITILFKPLGLNHFIIGCLGNLLGPAPSLFNEWEIPAKLFQVDQQRQILLLEDLLCRHYRPFVQPALKQALHLLDDFECEHTVEEIALAAGLPLRTFNRLFKAHLGVSPVVHRRIARFRHSLENKVFHDRFKKLIEIGYASNCYDQSDFIKLYHQMAGANPRALFGKLAPLADSRLVFEFINQAG